MMNSMKNYFRQLADSRDNGVSSKPLGPALSAASSVYGTAVKNVRGLYEKKLLKRRRLPFPVISVGNITWGGTGKTPLVEYLARRTSEHNRNVLILTRGYSQDEISQMQNHLPRIKIGVGKNRFETAQKIAASEKIDIAILDDGFQHWALERDLEVVTVNALNPFGNGKLLPRGILREPMDVLKRANVIVVTHANLVTTQELEKLKNQMKGIAPAAEIAESYLEPLFFYRAQKRGRLGIERLAKQRVTTFSGVGYPRSFQLLLSRCQIKTVRNFEFADHHVFTEKELQEVREMSISASTEEIITTEKDFFRSPDMISRILNPLVLATRLRFLSGEEMVNRNLIRVLGVPVHERSR